MSKRIFEKMFVTIYQVPKKTPATPELHLASLGLAVAPRPSHTAALRFAGERTGADDHLGERETSLLANNIYLTLPMGLVGCSLDD